MSFFPPAAFRFKDIEIPEEYMLGKLNQGFRIIHEGFEFARGLISLISTASASSALENGVAYLKERKAFGKEISRFQGLQFQLADHVARIEAAETVTYKALYMYDQEQKYHKFSRFEVSKQIAIAKLLSTTWAFDAINDALQWQGADDAEAVEIRDMRPRANSKPSCIINLFLAI